MRSSHLSALVSVCGSVASIGVLAGGGSAAPPPCLPGGAAIVPSSVSVQGTGSVPDIGLCHFPSAGVITLIAYAPGNDPDLMGTLAPTDVVRVAFTLPAGITTIATVIGGEIRGMTHDVATRAVVLEASPRPLVFTNQFCETGNCSVDFGDDFYNPGLLGGMLTPAPGDPDPLPESMNGLWVSTTAQDWSVDLEGVDEDGDDCEVGSSDECAPAVMIDLAGPHRAPLASGGALNQAHFKVFLPNALIREALKITDPAASVDLDLFRQEGTATEGDEVTGFTCEDAPGNTGKICTYGDATSHFSAPTFAIRTGATAPKRQQSISPSSGATPVEAFKAKAKALAGAWKMTKGKGTTTGILPSGATSVSQVATSGGAAVAERFTEMAASRMVKGRCTVKAVKKPKSKKVIKRTYSCSIKLPKGTWSVTTAARGTAGVVAEGTRRVVVK